MSSFPARSSSAASASVLVLVLSAFSWAQPSAPVVPRNGLRFDPARLTRVDEVLQKYVVDGRVAGAVALILQDGRPVYEKAFGWADKEAGRKMTPATLFRIASQTKAITSAAVLILMEEGKLDLEDPVGDFIPTFQKTTVAVRDGSSVKTVPAKRKITIKDLLTHTAGISYGTDAHVAEMYRAKGLGPAAGNGWYTADKDEPICETMERLGTLPFVAQPGEKYVYGYNTDILGCVVEKASGMPLDEFVSKRITGPLGMKDTRFFVPAGEKDRLAAVYMTGAGGKAVRAAEGSKGQGAYIDGPRKSFAGGAGLTSTARDYARFLEMIRRGGTLNGVRILSPRTVALMRTNQSGNLFNANGELGFGLGFQVTEKYGADSMTSVGAFGWGGAYGTTYKVDPESRSVVVLMLQLMPNETDVQTKFGNAVWQGLVE